MKEFLSPEQTTELIKIGLPEPRGSWETSVNVYTIGELLSFLPMDYTRTLGITIEFDGFEWFIEWKADGEIYHAVAHELIDALCNMFLELKNRGKHYKFRV